MEISAFFHEEYGGMRTITNWIVPALRKRHEVTENNSCICELETKLKKEDLGDLVFIHPDEDNKEGCYDAVTRLVGDYPDIPFYILALQDSKRSEPRMAGIGHHENVTYITDRNIKDVVAEIKGM
jgi:hypothetical protein